MLLQVQGCYSQGVTGDARGDALVEGAGAEQGRLLT